MGLTGFFNFLGLIHFLGFTSLIFLVDLGVAISINFICNISMVIK
jgi:hypothetical protein